MIQRHVRVRRESPKREAQRLASDRPFATSTVRGKRQAIKKVNPDRLAKRQKSYKQKLAAYRRSETYQIVEARAAGQCEMTKPLGFSVGHDSHGAGGTNVLRCQSVEDGKKFGHHHDTYARFGGDELPEDMRKLCDPCHATEEAKHPTRRHGR